MMLPNFGGSIMLKLENYTTKFIMDYLTNSIAKEKGITKTLARKLVLNALAYNIVYNAISEQIDFIMEEDEDE